SERTLPSRTCTQVRSVNTVFTERSATAGVGSTLSIGPRTVSGPVPAANPQPVNAMRTESGTWSPSAFAGDAGLRVGMQKSPDPNGVIGAPSPGRNIPLDRVAPSSSFWASAATASPIILASGRLRAGLVDPLDSGAVLSWVQAATAASAATATPATSRRRQRMGGMTGPPERSVAGGVLLLKSVDGTQAVTLRSAGKTQNETPSAEDLVDGAELGGAEAALPAGCHRVV